MNRHKANGVISLLMFKIVDYDYYIKAAKSIYVLSKNLKSVWNRGWLWLPCISAGNHNKTQDKSECGAEQWGAVRTGVTWPRLMLSLPPPSSSTGRKHLLTIKMQQNKPSAAKKTRTDPQKCPHQSDVWQWTGTKICDFTDANDDVSCKVKQLINIFLQIQQMKLLCRKKALLVKKSMQYTV